MDFVRVSTEGGIATVTIDRPKVNAINEQVVAELRDVFGDLALNAGVKAVILTAQGSFFSFGFDIPEFMGYTKDAFHRFVLGFSDLVQRIFVFPKPVVAALNGHTVAGGCVLAIACDKRIMITGKPKIALNELTIGASVFTSISEILKYAVGPRNAQSLLYTGRMISAEEALGLGLVDEAHPAGDFGDAVLASARGLAERSGEAFGTIKRLLRKHVIDAIEKDETNTVSDFVDIWYSPETREKLKKIEIRS
ncbi:MAG TPA: enoyl-CoA hydratase/isomerase family protein [Thermodesulfobacteriota bacterium]|nr:enoyl-CoA hydratase/isomerase family protein [Thermodesulfobacteriota bacterium]